MAEKNCTLSVSEIAKLCEVGHSTVGYWVRTNKLIAHRDGGSYRVPIEELLIFLKACGRRVPPDLAERIPKGPMFRTLQPCWEYWGKSLHGQSCETCTVYLNRLASCFTAKDSNRLKCRNSCHDCRYYQEIHLPRIQFVHQFRCPAAVHKDLYIWAGNSALGELCGISNKDFIGMGIEQLIYGESLGSFISNIRKWKRGDAGPLSSYPVFLKANGSGKIKAKLSVLPLQEPIGAYLISAAPLSNDVSKYTPGDHESDRETI